MDLCSSTIDLELFLGSVIIAIVFGIVSGIFSGYVVQYEQYQISIQQAKQENDAQAQKRYEYLKSQLFKRLKYLAVIVVIVVIVLLIVFSILSSSIPLACKVQLENENSQCNTTVNYIMNYYTYNVSQITVVEKSQTFSIEELKMLVQTKTGVI